MSTFALAIMLTTLWGITDEIHQAYVPGRNSDVQDVLADALGAVLGAGFYLILRTQLQRGASTGSVNVSVRGRTQSTLRIAWNASCGISTRPTFFMRFLPSFCFSRSLRLREISPP